MRYLSGMKTLLAFALLALSACAPLAAGGSAFASHPLGPGQQTSCITNVQQHAIGGNPYAYQTGYTTCR